MRYRRVGYKYTTYLTSAGLSWYQESEWQLNRTYIRTAPLCWCPPTDVYETASTIYLIVELAGMRPENLEIIFYEDAVLIEGFRHIRLRETDGIYHTAEIQQGPLRLEILLSSVVNLEEIDICYTQGLLHIALKKR